MTDKDKAKLEQLEELREAKAKQVRALEHEMLQITTMIHTIIKK